MYNVDLRISFSNGI